MPFYTNASGRVFGPVRRFEWTSLRSSRAFHQTRTQTSKTKKDNTSIIGGGGSGGGGGRGGGEPRKKATFFTWYVEKLESHPITTKCVTSGIISGSGDIIGQYIVHKHQQEEEQESTLLTKGDSHREDGGDSFTLDWKRTGRFAFLGFALIAPAVHNWYGLLLSSIPGQTTKSVLKRLFCDQILFAPLFLSTFMTSLMALEGKDLSNAPRVLERDLPSIIVSNWTLWIPAMFVNFKFVPLQWQVLCSNCVGLVWNIYLSWKTQVGGKDI